MSLITQLAAAAGLAALAFTAVPSAAEGQYRGYYDRGWNGPEGHFLVYARACPDLREDFRDARRTTSRADRREDRRDRRILDCPPRAWEYVPSRRELRMGRTGERLRPDYAYFDRRSGRYFVETRWGGVPVQIVRGRGFHRAGGYYDYWGWRH